MSSPPSDPPDVTRLLERWRQGDDDAFEQASAVVYPELRRIADAYLRRERSDHTLQPTALVHEAFLRLTAAGPLQFENRKHFFAVAARLMRHILVDHARAVRADKRGGHVVKITLGHGDGVIDQRQLADEFLALHDAIDRLGTVSPRKARIIELRYFGGLSLAEAAEVVGVSTATAHREQRLAEAWLSECLTS